MDYTLIRSSRHTLAIQIVRSWDLIVRAPHRMSITLIEDFIMRKSDWIEKHQEKIQHKEQKTEKKNYTENEIKEMKKRLEIYLIPRVRELWTGKNLPPYTSIKITKSERRWWSCSGKNGLCFSYRLAEWLKWENTNSYTNTVEYNQNNTTVSSVCVCVSPFIDAIIIHELAHLREKHHQKSFWDLVYSMMPEYENIMKSTI